jgi:hypothetical protein
VAASSVAVVLWSASFLKDRAFSGALAIYGLVLGPLTVLALFSGHLRLNVHGFGMVMLGQALWFIAAAVRLFRDAPQPAH